MLIKQIYQKIYGNYFCYKEILYKDLLYNGQIIKKGEECSSEYNKNCGRLDTLEQELCIKENEKCPLYDIGLGSQSDIDNYKSIDNKIYYNNENYNKPNKKIIRRLILNEGQPCYNSTEKLWRRFSSEEGFQTNLECHMQIFDKYYDDRYEKKESISYKQLYEDNLSPECQNLVLNYLTDSEKVSLYKREFFGIDKQCDEKYNLNNNTYTILHDSEKSCRLLLIIGGIITATLSIGLIIGEIVFSSVSGSMFDDFSTKDYCIQYTIFILVLVPIFICLAVYYSRIVNNDLSSYNCSDEITNEIIRIGMETSKENIPYIQISFYLESALLGLTFFAALIAVVSETIIKRLTVEPKKYEEKNKNNIHINEKSEIKSDEIPRISHPTPN